jgi:hypothetical protein
MPIVPEGSYMTVSLYAGAKFLVERHFTSLDDFRIHFVDWFENVSFQGGKEHG